jgi:outer membrane protein TolC
VQLSEAKSDQISYHDNVILSRERLSQAMGLPMDDRSLQGELPVVDPALVLGKLSKVDFAERPDLKANDFQAQAAEKRSAADAAFWVPQVSLIGEVQWYDRQDASTVDPNNIINTGHLDDSYYVGASVKWDLFDGGVSWAKSKEAHAKADAAKADRDEARMKAPYDYDLWRRTLVSKASLYQARLTDIDKAKESARLATLGFTAGTRTTTDVLDAELEVFKATAGMVQAQVDALEALINLEITLGRRINRE